MVFLKVTSKVDFSPLTLQLIDFSSFNFWKFTFNSNIHFSYFSVIGLRQEEERQWFWWYKGKIISWNWFWSLTWSILMSINFIWLEEFYLSVLSPSNCLWEIRLWVDNFFFAYFQIIWRYKQIYLYL